MYTLRYHIIIFDNDNGRDVLYHHAKFGEIELRAATVGAKMWCMFLFVCLSRPEAGALFVKG